MTKSIDLKFVGLVLALGLVIYALFLFIRKAGNIGSAINNILTSPIDFVSGVSSTLWEEVKALWNYFMGGIDIGNPSPGNATLDANKPTSNITYDAGNFDVGNGTSVHIDPNSPLGQAFLNSNWNSFYLNSEGSISAY